MRDGAKAWFQEDDLIATMIRAAPHSQTRAKLDVLQPQTAQSDLPVYAGGDAEAITTGGELNKIASNIAMGRSMGRALANRQHAQPAPRRTSRDGDAGSAHGGLLGMSGQHDLHQLDRHQVKVDKSGVQVMNDPVLQEIHNSTLP